MDAEPGRHTGAPVIAGALARLECRLVTVHDGGDHAALLGSVPGAHRGPADDALLFHEGAFRRLQVPA
ncbi:MAG TPA: flavin reductase family protein [Streptomyces sp.]|nr:flavin reductase family protein [Streptomyces sp.]HWU08259.1 flavin reductase family protein [Streptomyces sp.]